MLDISDRHERLAFGATIRALRGLHGMTQPALGELIGLSTVTLRELERGVHNHQRHYHVALLVAFGVEAAQWRQIEAIYLIASQRLAS